MIGLLTAIWWLVGALTAASIAYLLLALASVAAYRSPSRSSGNGTLGKVTLLKPVSGLEDGLEEAITSFLAQETSFAVHFVFGAADAQDPALLLCRKIAAHFPDRQVSFVADSRIHGANPKVSNLINMASEGLDEVIVLSDSDIVIAPGVLQRAVDTLGDPGVGAATALYRSRPGIPGDRIRIFGGWFLDYWFLPMAVLHARLSPLSVTYGPLTAIRREVLAGIGGIEALADHLSDDAELGRRVRELGWAVVFTPDIAETLVNDANQGELFNHELRWARTVRGLDPIGFAASVVSHPGPLPLLLLLQPGILAAAGISLPLILRWLLVRAVEKKFGRSDALPRPHIFALWWRDTYCFLVWMAAWRTQSVDWRGRTLTVDRGDLLQETPAMRENNR